MTIEQKYLNRRVDRYGNVVYSGDMIYENIYRGFGTDAPVDASPDIEEYNQIMDKFGLNLLKVKTYKKPEISIEEFHARKQKEWNMPILYLELDIYEYFSTKIETKEEIKRVHQELELFEKYECFDVLRFLIYLVDTFKEHNLVWGVGRGSSVASYCLYLIGVHKVDSIKYDLDMEEFFKEVKF